MIKTTKMLAGFAGVLVGFILFTIIMNSLNNQTMLHLVFQPIEALDIYFFGFSFGMGDLGTALGTFILIGFLSLCYYLAIVLYKKLNR